MSYNYLGPFEVCRLKIGDLNLEDKKICENKKQTSKDQNYS